MVFSLDLDNGINGIHGEQFKHYAEGVSNSEMFKLLFAGSCGSKRSRLLKQKNDNIVFFYCILSLKYCLAIQFVV